MSRTALRRVVESFFRRWPVHLLLLVAPMMVGFLVIRQSTDQFVASGAIFVDSESLVTTQSGVQTGTQSGFLSPAQFTSQDMFGMILTDVFMESVVDTAGIELSTGRAARRAELFDLRSALSVQPSSNNIVQIRVNTSDPELSGNLARAVISEFIEFQIRADIAESGASEEFFTELVESYEEDLAEARAALDAAVRGVAAGDEIAPRQQLEIDRLQAAETLSEERYQGAVDDLDGSRLAMLQTETDIRQSYSVLDVPEDPARPGGAFRDNIITLATYAVVGLILALLAPIGSALLSRSLIFPDDLDPAAPAQVIATLPKVRKRRLDVARDPGIRADTGMGSEVAELDDAQSLLAELGLDSPTSPDAPGNSSGIVNGSAAGTVEQVDQAGHRETTDRPLS